MGVGWVACTTLQCWQPTGYTQPPYTDPLSACLPACAAAFIAAKGPSPHCMPMAVFPHRAVPAPMDLLERWGGGGGGASRGEAPSPAAMKMKASPCPLPAPAPCALPHHLNARLHSTARHTACILGRQDHDAKRNHPNRPATVPVSQHPGPPILHLIFRGPSFSPSSLSTQVQAALHIVQSELRSLCVICIVASGNCFRTPGGRGVI